MMPSSSRVFLRNGAFRKLFIVGIGQVVPHAVACARAAGVHVTVMTSERQIGARDASGVPLTKSIAARGGKVVEAKDLSAFMTADPSGTIILSFGSPWIFRSDLIARFDGRVINSHAAPLPEWRGGGGFSWRILADDRRGASCFHLVTPGIDDGDIVLYKPYAFPKPLRLPREWEAHALKHEKSAVTELVKGLAKGAAFKLRRQDATKSTYVPRLHTPTQAWIDWSWPAAAIERFVLAFSHDYPGARTYVNGAEVRIFDVRRLKAAPAHPFMSGLVLRRSEDKFFVQALDGLLAVKLTDIEGGAKIREGDRFSTPTNLLDNALETRAAYGPEGVRIAGNAKS